MLRRVGIRRRFVDRGLGAAASNEIRLVDAVKTGDRASAVALVRRHVDVDIDVLDGTTPLHVAARLNGREGSK
jgi:DNA-binding GntR family transcriptional regulator